MSTVPIERQEAGDLYAWWQRLSPLPGGARLFSIFLSRYVPYTGTIHPAVVALRPGYARVVMRDRRIVRNHLDSIHALALANLAEVTSGLALLAGIPPEGRGILTGLSIEYLKKARGTLTAEASVEVPDVTERRECACEAAVRDAAGDVVARATTRWLVGPKQRR